MSTKTELGSYFISNYPPFSQWSSEFLHVVERAFHRPPASVPLGLYLHIPFCRKRCKFCYFRVYTDKNAPEVERYLTALCREIELLSRLPIVGNRDLRFVYFGGGTPSYLSAKQLTSQIPSPCLATCAAIQQPPDNPSTNARLARYGRDRRGTDIRQQDPVL